MYIIYIHIYPRYVHPPSFESTSWHTQYPNPTNNILVGLGDPQNFTRLLLFWPPSNGRTVTIHLVFFIFPPVPATPSTIY